jgi:hypothetical protein
VPLLLLLLLLLLVKMSYQFHPGFFLSITGTAFIETSPEEGFHCNDVGVFVTAGPWIVSEEKWPNLISELLVGEVGSSISPNGSIGW